MLASFIRRRRRRASDRGAAEAAALEFNLQHIEIYQFTLYIVLYFRILFTKFTLNSGIYCTHTQCLYYINFFYNFFWPAHELKNIINIRKGLVSSRCDRSLVENGIQVLKLKSGNSIRIEKLKIP